MNRNGNVQKITRSDFLLSLETLCRNTGNIVPVGPSVISTAGRNPRSVTSVRDDNSVFSRCDTVSDPNSLAPEERGISLRNTKAPSEAKLSTEV
jgi:hypothetical protein